MSYINYIIPFLLSLILSLILTPLVRKFAIKKNIAIPKPRTRDVHAKPIPRIGGIAIFVSFYLVIIALLIFSPDKLKFVNETFLGIDKNLFGFLLAGFVWIIVGSLDDIRGVKPFYKFFWQGVCGLIIVFFGIKIFWLANPTGGLNIGIGWLTYLLVPMWIGLIMNVLNWFDGIDAEAPGISIISLIILFLLSIEPNVNQSATAMLCAVLAGSVIGFFPYNWYPAKIFLGDSGSMFLGLAIGTFSIISGAKLATAALVLGLPIIDAFWVIVQRLSQKKSPFYPDKTHFHHKLLEAGLLVRQTVLVVYTISAAFGIIALRSNTIGKMQAGLWLLLLIITISIVLIFIKKKRIKNV